MKTHVIDGVTYVEVDRKAKVGDLLIMPGLPVIYKIEKYPEEGANCLRIVDDICDRGTEFDVTGEIVYANSLKGFVILEPLVSEEPTQVTDLLANLARRVHSLEQQLSDTQNNVERQAEELANTMHRVSKHATMFGIVEERIGVLDERSQVLNAINKFYEEGSR
jgi:hypothetical protein